MFLKLVALLLCVTYASCDIVRALNCPNQTAHCSDVNMEVSGCSTEDEECKLVQGHSYDVHFVFKTSKDYKQKTDFRVYGVFSPSLVVPYGKRMDACSSARTTDDGATCPSLGGFLAFREFKHASQFNVSSNYPTVGLNARFVILERRSKEVLLCKEIKIKITKPTPTPSPATENEA